MYRIFIYTHETKLGFGKYKGEALKDIVIKDPYYIDWCIREIESFYISDFQIAELKKIRKNFKLSRQTLLIQKEKQKEFDRMEEENFRDYLSSIPDDIDRNTFDKLYGASVRAFLQRRNND